MRHMAVNKRPLLAVCTCGHLLSHHNRVWPKDVWIKPVSSMQCTVEGCYCHDFIDRKSSPVGKHDQ